MSFNIFHLIPMRVAMFRYGRARSVLKFQCFSFELKLHLNRSELEWTFIAINTWRHLRKLRREVATSHVGHVVDKSPVACLIAGSLFGRVLPRSISWRLVSASFFRRVIVPDSTTWPFQRSQQYYHINHSYFIKSKQKVFFLHFN